MRNDNSKLADLAQAFSVKIQHIFYGSDFSGRWRRSMPVNRFIYIFEEGPAASRIIGEHQVFEMLPGRWLLIPAGHTAEHEQCKGLELVSIHFNLMYYSNPDLVPISGDMHQGAAPELMEDFRKLTIDAQPELSDVLHLQSLLYLFLMPILERAEAHLTQYFCGLQEFQPLFDEFQQAPHRNFSVDDMARAMKMGKESFVKKFTAAMKIPPKKFFNRLRASNASYRISASSATIREISESFGFANEFYFSRFFKQHLGMSPREWRDSKHLSM